jgi:hypothetical protein
MRKWLLGGATVVVVALLAVGAAWYLHVKHAGRDIQGSSTVEFIPTPPPPKPKEPGVAWPMYGHDAQRLRVATGISLAPPFRRAWTFHAQSLVEFPPVIAYGRLFFANNAGVLFAINAMSGKRAWKYDSKRCQAMSPGIVGLGERLRRAAHDLREDDAGVAAGSQERRARDLLREPDAVVDVRSLERLDDRAYGEGQVRPRVAVGDRVHVQVVDPLTRGLDRPERRARPGEQLDPQTALVTLPLFRQRVQTYARRATPSTRTLTRWRFGSKRRFVATIE